MLGQFRRLGKASFILGGQWGSEGKGAAAAFAAVAMRERHEGFDIVSTNAGAQAGHTSTHDGRTRVVFHLPTFSLYNAAVTYLNAGSIIDPDGLLRELEENPHVLTSNCFAVHPNAAIITQACKDAEMRDDSAQTKIASTRKGVGEALARKVLRSGKTAKDEPRLARWVRPIDLNRQMQNGAAVLVEVPQGHSLSIDGPFYPHTTSRNCTVMQAMSDAGIHPDFYHQSMMVIRIYPIRVGNIEQRLNIAGQPDANVIKTVGYSGDYYPDQHETSWDALGVEAEITTVTKRVRRVFTFSEQQVAKAIAQTRPSVIYLTFCDYLRPSAVDSNPDDELLGDSVRGRRIAARRMVARLRNHCREALLNDPEILTQWGPTTADVIRAEDL